MLCVLRAQGSSRTCLLVYSTFQYLQQASNQYLALCCRLKIPLPWRVLDVLEEVVRQTVWQAAVGSFDRNRGASCPAINRLPLLLANWGFSNNLAIGRTLHLPICCC